MQLRVWRDLLDRGSRLTVRMLTMTLRMRGHLDLGLLRDSIEIVVARHEALRTRFSSVDGLPSQHFDAPLTWDIVDVSGGAQAEVERRAEVAARECMDERIIISAGPLLAVRVLHLADLDHVLIVSLEHMICDAASEAIIREEIWSVYCQAALGRRPSLPPASVQFGDYALWQKRTHLAWRKKHEPYWMERLRGTPTIRLPVDDSPRQESATGPMEFWLGSEISTRLRDLARRERCLLSIAMFVIYVIVMSRWCRQSDLLVTFVSSGRNRASLDRTVGWLANHFYLRISLQASDTFQDLLKRASHEFVMAMAHHDFDRVPDLLPECQTDLYFNWLPVSAAPALQNNGGSSNPALTILPFPMKKQYSSKFTSFFFDGPLGIGVYIDYAVHLYTRDTVQRFVDNLRRTADAVSKSPLALISDSSELLRQVVFPNERSATGKEDNSGPPFGIGKLIATDHG